MPPKRPERRSPDQPGTLRQQFALIVCFLDLNPGQRPLDRRRTREFARLLTIPHAGGAT
jgi:hypothetical protein